MLLFLKLGGSLLTDKNRPYTVLPDRLQALSAAIAEALHAQPDLRLLLGHGSGSFGHWAAREGNIRHGIQRAEDWRHFVRIGAAARQLNTLVMQALLKAGVAAVPFPPQAAAIAQDGRIHHWDTAPLQAALAAGLVPVTYGDVIFDRARGGIIVSTEEIFTYLAPRLRPQRLLIAGIAPGVCADYPECRRLVPQITPASLPALASAIGGSAGVDVTGGMASKVRAMTALVAHEPEIEVLIFDGRAADTLRHVLLGGSAGTRIVAAV